MTQASKRKKSRPGRFSVLFRAEAIVTAVVVVEHADNHEDAERQARDQIFMGTPLMRMRRIKSGTLRVQTVIDISDPNGCAPDSTGKGPAMPEHKEAV